ncbi:class I SAM-dependent methyltransferase [Rhodotorula paludigena]|uniref:class I SAM-dependent methyltransferase n=1 Tax=Rhodotorula paludigena TaxID=86838 RepID=UPI00317B5D61
MELQPYARDLSSFLSYSRSAQDWDGLRTSLLFSNSLQGSVALSTCKSLTEGDKPVAPRRVLDIGCGATPFWILEMAGQDAWEKTRFVGLDIAPSAVSTVLPTELESRLTFIQHDCRDALPFQPAEFDFVRTGFLNLSLREQDWAALCEEAIRVLTPGGILEVVDEDHMVLGDKGTASLPGKRLVAVDDLFSDILHHGFINPRALTVLPSSLAMSGGSHLRSTGRISLDLLSSPDPPSSCDKELLEKFAPSRTSSSAAMRTTETRVLLHAYADRWTSSSFGLARAAVTVRHRAKPDVGSCRGELAPDLEQQELDGVEDLVHAWTDDLRGRPDIASLLRSRLGWEPAFDYALQEALETNLAKLDAQMQEDLQRKTLHNEVFGTANCEAESAMLQREYSRRETAAELEQVTQRLQGRPAALEERVGSLDFEVFVVQKP